MGGFTTQGLDHIAIAVADLDRSESFYAEVLGLERAHPAWDPPRMMMSAGSGIALFPEGEDFGAATAPHIRHIAFRVDRAAFDTAREELADRGVETRYSDHGAAHSVYFEDPDGHRLELTTYDV